MVEEILVVLGIHGLLPPRYSFGGGLSSGLLIRILIGSGGERQVVQEDATWLHEAACHFHLVVA